MPESPWAESFYKLRKEDISDTVSYIGEAMPGSAEDSPVWRIKKMDTSSGITIDWAEGVSTFTKKWSLRATYSYS